MVSVVCVGAIGRPAGVQAWELCGHGNGWEDGSSCSIGACLLLRSVSAKFTNEGSMSTEQMHGTVLKIPFQAILLQSVLF